MLLVTLSAWFSRSHTRASSLPSTIIHLACPGPSNHTPSECQPRCTIPSDLFYRVLVINRVTAGPAATRNIRRLFHLSLLSRSSNPHARPITHPSCRTVVLLAVTRPISVGEEYLEEARTKHVEANFSPLDGWIARVRKGQLYAQPLPSTAAALPPSSRRFLRLEA